MEDETKNNQEKPKKPNLLKKFVMGLANILTLGLAGKIRKRIKIKRWNKEIYKECNYSTEVTVPAYNRQEAQSPQVSNVSSEELKEAQDVKQVEKSSIEETAKKDDDKTKEQTNSKEADEEEKQMQ